MSRRLDCAVLTLPATATWLGPAWQVPALGALYLRHVPLGDAAWDGDASPQASYTPAASQALARMAPALQRFDVCVLPVSPETLAWTRVALAGAAGLLPVPLVLVARQVAAGALGDLLGLGAADFVAHAARTDEVKARLAHWALRRSPATLVLRDVAVAGPCAGPASAPQPAAPVSWPLASRAASYRDTRADVLARFERDYVTGMLVRFRGNVTHAARAGQQDRRAFWQLMRKYGVLSADFRQAAE